jgi:hypothetical protein
MQFVMVVLAVVGVFAYLYVSGNRQYQRSIARWLQRHGYVPVAGVRRMNPLQDKYVKLEIKDTQGRRYLVELQVRGTWQGSYLPMAKVKSQRELDSWTTSLRQ